MKFSRLLAASTAVGAVLLASTAAWAATSVTKVRIGEHPTKTRIVLDLTGKPLYQYTLSADRRQLYVDLPETQWDARMARSLKRSKFIRGYSYADGRLTIETNKPVTVSKAIALRPHQGKGHRLFFDLADAPANFLAPAPAPAPEPVAEMQPEPEPAPEVAPMEPVVMEEPAAAPEQMAEATPEPQDADPWGSGGGSSMRSSGPSGPYFRIDAGYALSGNADIKQAGYTGSIDDIGNSPVFDLGLGYQVNENFRTDVTLGYIGGHEISASDTAGTRYTADITAITGMVNGYIDIPTGSNMVPYIGVGVGASQNTLGDVARSGSTTVKGDENIEFAYQGMAGVGFMADRNWTIDLGYRYLNAGALDSQKLTTGNAVVDDFNGKLIDHQVMLGARYGW